MEGSAADLLRSSVERSSQVGEPRVIRLRRSAANTVSTVSTVSGVRDFGSEPISEGRSKGRFPVTAINMISCHTSEALSAGADDADGAEERSPFLPDKAAGED